MRTDLWIAFSETSPHIDHHYLSLPGSLNGLDKPTEKYMIVANIRDCVRWISITTSAAWLFTLSSDIVYPFLLLIALTSTTSLLHPTQFFVYGQEAIPWCNAERSEVHVKKTHEGPIYKMSREEATSEAAWPERRTPIPMIQITFPPFSAKSVHPSVNLPAHSSQ